MKLLAFVGAILLLSFFVNSCLGHKLAPEEVYINEDSCAYCKMLISDIHFSAQLLKLDAETKKFDDVVCLLNYLATQNQAREEAIYVYPFQQKGWVKAQFAIYLVSENISTPMGSGICVFLDRGEAEDAKETYGGRIATWDELLEEFAKLD